MLVLNQDHIVLGSAQTLNLKLKKKKAKKPKKPINKKKNIFSFFQ